MDGFGSMAGVFAASCAHALGALARSAKASAARTVRLAHRHDSLLLLVSLS
jgi:hypothetical protein